MKRNSVTKDKRVEGEEKQKQQEKGEGKMRRERRRLLRMRKELLVKRYKNGERKKKLESGREARD